MTPISMKCIRALLTLSFSFIAVAQQPSPMEPSKKRAMLAAISRDSALVTGGIGPGRQSKPGQAYVEPIAYLTDTGRWQSLPCGAGREGIQPKGCEQFGRQYLNKPHAYTVISADGEGTVVRSASVQLSECGNYTANGTYTGAAITRMAIAASNPDFFSHIDAPMALQREAAEPILQALATLVPKRLDSTKWLKVISLRLEGYDLIVVKREFGDLPETANVSERGFIFSVGTVDNGRFRVQYWKENSNDEEECILGVIRLNNGRDFLITSVSDPEGHWFRVYGIRNGQLSLIFSGGGWSC
jgi:hypothetical protein